MGEPRLPPEQREEEPDERVPMLFDEEVGRRFAEVRVVQHQRGSGGQDLAWHDELQAGSRCPACTRHTLKRNHTTVYCSFCRLRWWSRRQVG